MTEVLVTSSAMTVTFALVAIIMGWFLLRWLDRMGGVVFEQTVKGICDEPVAAALYFGLRFVGVCVLLGMVIS